MFGLVQVCGASLGAELRAQWEAHLCGPCLTLRDTRGQWARAFTNTDAAMLLVLVEAQQVGPPPRVTAGACPLRGMRTAQDPHRGARRPAEYPLVSCVGVKGAGSVTCSVTGIVTCIVTSRVAVLS